MALDDPRELVDFYDLLPVSNVRLFPQLYQQVDGQASGDLLVQDEADPLWSATVNLDVALLAEARDLDALLNSMPPPRKFYLRDVARRLPAADPDNGVTLGGCSITVRSIGEDNSSVAFSGFAPGYVLSRGDFWHVDFGADPARRGFFQLLEGDAADEFGNTLELAVTPSVWPGIAEDLAVTFIDAACQMMITPQTYTSLTFRRGGGWRELPGHPEALMRDNDADSIAALAAAPIQGIIARQFIWITANSLADGTPASFGFWNGRLPVTLDVVVGADGSTESRTYEADGAVISVDKIPLSSDLNVRNASFILSMLHPTVRTLWGEYVLKLAKVKIHRAPFTPTGRLPVAPPRRRFKGSVDTAPKKTPTPSAEGGLTVNCVSASADLRVINPVMRSDESQKLRSGDRHSKYADVVGTWEIMWGGSS